MASKTVKFEVELKGLRVKFEGDIQIAERFSGEIASAVNNLASAQQRLLPAAPNAPTTSPPLDAGSRRGGRRRRRSVSASGGIDPSIIVEGTTEEANSSGAPETTEGRRRRSGAGQSALLMSLKQEGFFAEKRTIADIREALAKKGHTFKSSDISPTLEPIS